jgi:hypothetical protein
MTERADASAWAAGQAHVFAQIGGGFYVATPPPSKADTLAAVGEILAESPEPRETARLLSFSVKVISNDAIRQLRQLREELRPHPLDGLRWEFPTWCVRKRPFDWAIDGPGAPDPTPMPLPERARLRLPLRSPAPVVQR